VTVDIRDLRFVTPNTQFTRRTPLALAAGRVAARCRLTPSPEGYRIPRFRLGGLRLPSPLRTSSSLIQGALFAKGHPYVGAAEVRPEVGALPGLVPAECCPPHGVAGLYRFAPRRPARNSKRKWHAAAAYDQRHRCPSPKDPSAVKSSGGFGEPAPPTAQPSCAGRAGFFSDVLITRFNER